jgi:cytochrome d ubiquinol oxidase subunit II
MISAAVLLAGVMAFALIVYVVSAGADYGGGVWDLLAQGPRQDAQRKVIADAIGPIWEANHDWIILVVVILFTAFPSAFAMLTIHLHIPLTLMLIGVVLRGSAFAFRSYDTSDARARWGKIFAIASLITPVILGAIIGTIASGRIRQQTDGFISTYVAPWIGIFPWTVGLFALSLFAFLAAVYLLMETDDPALQEDFRKKALRSSAVTFVLGGLVLIAAKIGAPFLYSAFLRSDWAFPIMAANTIFLGVTVFLVFRRKYRFARFSVVLPVATIIFGWTLAQFPYLIPPYLTIEQASAPPATLHLLIYALASGSIILFPALFYLYRVFKRESGLPNH